MSLQRQHFLLSHLKTLSVGPAGVRTHDLPHGSPVLNQLSQPVGGNNPDDLLNRLELLAGSILAGNDGVKNEFSQIAQTWCPMVILGRLYPLLI